MTIKIIIKNQDEDVVLRVSNGDDEEEEDRLRSLSERGPGDVHGTFRVCLTTYQFHVKGRHRPIENFDVHASRHVVSLSEAQAYARDLGPGWRLPTKAEWDSFAENPAASKIIHDTALAVFYSGSRNPRLEESWRPVWYWSSSRDEDGAALACYVSDLYMSTETNGGSDDDIFNRSAVFCIRDISPKSRR
jgi:hypothetical protein